MTEAAEILTVEGLSLEVRRRGAAGSIVHDASLRVGQGEIVGLIGESGSGKTMTAKALLGLLPERVTVSAGRAMFGGRDLLSASPRELRAIRGAEGAATTPS